MVELLPKSIGFIGIGSMGYPMAVNLRMKIPANIPFYVYDLSTSSVDKFINDTSSIGNVIASRNCKDVGQNADFIMTVLPDGAIVKDAYLSPDTGVVAGV